MELRPPAPVDFFPSFFCHFLSFSSDGFLAFFFLPFFSFLSFITFQHRGRLGQQRKPRRRQQTSTRSGERWMAAANRVEESQEKGEEKNKTQVTSNNRSVKHTNSTTQIIERRCEAKKVAGTRSNLKVNFCFWLKWTVGRGKKHSINSPINLEI